MNGLSPLPDEMDEFRVLTAIACRAVAADQGQVDLSEDIRMLHASGHLARLVENTGPQGDPTRAVRFLCRLGRSSLSVGRLVEGHANAILLVSLYGSDEQVRRVRDDAAQGILYGVWGADGKPPLSMTKVRPDGCELTGTKAFCSGLGLVGRAVLIAPSECGGPQMLLADVSDPSRADASVWKVSGMRATASGRYECDGMRAELLGATGDFLREPYFEGGTWRYAALHVGALEALAEAFRLHIRTRAEEDDPHQRHRLANVVRLVETARLWVESAAIAVSDAVRGDTEVATARALLAREAVEQCCMDALALCDRGIGTAGFRTGSKVDLVRRDLGLFLRQANLDGKLETAAATLLRAEPAVGEIW